MARKSLQSTFNQIISGTQKKYGALFECTCAPLNRKRQPFRDEATKNIVNDLSSLFSPQKNTSFIIAFEQPGGLLFEFILINQLIHQGFTTLTIILIQNNSSSKALLSFRSWFKRMSKKTHCTILHFKTKRAYTKSCQMHSELKCHALIAIDPDRASEIPQWNVEKWRKKWQTTYQNVCAPFCYQASLFFQSYVAQERKKQALCHLVRTITIGNYTTKNMLTLGTQQSGHSKFTTKTTFAFWGIDRILPLAKGIQILNLITDQPQTNYLRREEPALAALNHFLQQEQTTHLRTSPQELQQLFSIFQALETKHVENEENHL